MNLIRIVGIGAIIVGVLLGYFFDRTEIHLLSGVLIGVGIGWAITGKLNTGSRPVGSKVRSE
ncbi:hypothetical protein [Christiangramia sabulilitoris]|uniref:Uncharacterized protein n=1 Tax=Christiangramia sabulilitoris TaxID=2583991 RepID=A0A550I061_9FLAO|nr:hypothetical protein [Christiangramia sabulilitoris]TRO64369.1 hypothetical protein FGM01_12830 [Christiangramia sabulilitoris]